MKALNALKGHVPLMLVRTLSDCMSTTALAWSQNPGPLEWVRPPSSLIPSPNEHVCLGVLPPSPVYNSQKNTKALPLLWTGLHLVRKGHPLSRAPS